MTRIRPNGPRLRSLASLAPALLGALAVSLLPGCDNPACIFGPNGCQEGEGGGGTSATAATFPVHGEWIVSGAPRVEASFPQGTASATSPIVLVFSESISPLSINGAFELRQVGGIVTGPNALTGELMGDGRVLVLFAPPLVGGAEYEVVWAEGSSIRDLTGSLALRPVDGVAASFTVDEAPGDAPEVVMTWPLDSTVGQSPISEVLTVFDRPLDPTSVTPTSWRVLVDGNEPTFNPPAAALVFDTSGLGQPSQTIETRVWTWRSEDPGTELPASLGTGASVALELSPVDGTRITTPDGVPLGAAAINFTTQVFAPPTVAEIVSAPTDAIGIDNFNGNMPLMIAVDLEQPAEEGDVLEIWEFGTQQGSTDGTPPSDGIIVALARSYSLDAGTVTAVLGNEELQLLLSSSPLTPRFEDGDVGFAFAVNRGGTSSPLRVLDVDPTESEIQDALLDTVPPQIEGLADLPPGGTDYRGNTRDLVVVGSANEQLSSVEVIATLSGGTVDNRVGGELPPLPAMTASGDFIAAPLALGAIDASELPVDFSFIVYDRALNASQPYFASWTQLGSTGPAAALPGTGADVEVTVYDSVTLAPIEGATVYSHEVVAGALTAFVPGPQTTDAAGKATIASALTGDTILTVEAAGYDLFSFHDVQTTRLDVPLKAEGLNVAVVQPTALSEGEDLASEFFTTWIADSRVLLPGETLHEGNACSYNPLTDQTLCTFSPEVIQAGRLGLLTFFATKEPADQLDPNAFSASSFLQAYEASFPRPKTQKGGIDALPLAVGPLLSGASVDPADVPLGVPNHTLEKPTGFAASFPNLVGLPQVSVEVLVDGLPGAMTVGIGKSYENVLGDNYDLRAAYSALAKSGGEYATTGLIRDTRYLRSELVDLSGARTGVRRALAGSSGVMTPLPPPAISAPSITVSGTSYAVVYEDVISGSADGTGLARLTLVDTNGRRWEIWQPDPVGVEPTVTAFLPPIDLLGGVPLADGPVTCSISEWAWSGYDPAEFLFTDPDREHEEFLTTAPTIWAQQP